MGKMIGCMVTWTTYGTWLQGDKKGYVKDGEILGENAGLGVKNLEEMKGDKVRLKKQEKEIVREAIEKEAERFGQQIHAIAVFSNHLHIVFGGSDEELSNLVKQCKKAAYFALREKGFEGKVWTRGYDKRYCYDEKALQSRIEYVKRHK